MKKVLYLCRASENSDDLLFAPELPENYYAPGQFVIEAMSVSGQLHTLYKFSAMQGNQELELELKPTERGRSYAVDAGNNGKFFFKVVAMSRGTRYAGQSNTEFEGMPLYRLEPANMQQLEQACRRRDFYFIGNSGGADA